MSEPRLSPLQKLRSPVAAVRLQGLEELRRRGETEVPSAAEQQALLDCLGASEKSVQRQAAELLAALAVSGVDVSAPLLAALGASNFHGRWAAAFALSLCGRVPPRAHPVLFEAIGADDADVRWAAADILARQVPRGILVPELCRCLQDGTPAQRKMAAYCLRQLGARSPEIESALVNCLQDDTAGVRLAAVTALARLATDRRATAERLSLLLDDAETGVRRSVAATLGSLAPCSDAVIAALRRASTDDDPSLRRAATHALRRLRA